MTLCGRTRQHRQKGDELLVGMLEKGPKSHKLRFFEETEYIYIFNTRHFSKVISSNWNMQMIFLVMSNRRQKIIARYGEKVERLKKRKRDGVRGGG